MQRPYYGWYIAASLAVTETISWGVIYYAFSVFIAPMEAELGWSRTTITGAFSSALLMSAASAYPVGYWVDRFGARLLMTVGASAASLLIIAWSQVHDPRTFYAIWMGLGVCFAALLYEPAFAVVAQWFVQKRGQALALITFAAGLASTIFLPLADWLLGQQGWRGAVFTLGVMLGLTTVPLHLLILRRSPRDIGLEGEPSAAVLPPPPSATVEQAVRSVAYWQLVGAFALSTLATAAIRIHFIPFLLTVGIRPSTAALATGAIGFMQVAGRAVFAPLDSRWSAQRIVVGVFGLQALAMVILLLTASTSGLVLFIVVFGTSVGAKTLARPSMLVALYGPARYGRISSIMSVFLTLAGTVAPVGAGLFYDRFGDYQAVLWMALALNLGATLTAAFIHQPAPA